jgi:hypothetical protein
VTTTAHVSAYITAGQRVQAVLQSFLVPEVLELFTDGVYCLKDESVDYSRQLLPHVSVKSSGVMPAVKNGNSLCGLRVNMEDLGSCPDFDQPHKVAKEFNKRNHELLGPFDHGMEPSIITGAAGSGKTTLMHMTSLPDAAFCSPTHLLRVDAAEKFDQTMCHARLAGSARPITGKYGRSLENYPPGNLIVDEATMLTQKDRLKIEELAKTWGSRLFYLGDYHETFNTPMQCSPIDFPSMTTIGLRRFHVDGVKRTSDPMLLKLQSMVRKITQTTAGGYYLMGDLKPAVELVQHLIVTGIEKKHEEQGTICNQILAGYEAVCEPDVCSSYKTGSVILAATRVCPHCKQSTVERCKCSTAKCLEDINFAGEKAKAQFVQNNTDEEGKLDVSFVREYTSIAFMYAQSIQPDENNQVACRCTKSMRGCNLVNGQRFISDAAHPTYDGIDLTRHIGSSITHSPASTIHAYQGITFEGERSYIDFTLIWDVKMLYVALSRVRSLDQIFMVRSNLKSKHIGEGAEHKLQKAECALAEYKDVNRIIEEYPVGDGRFVADLAVFDTANRLLKLIEVVHINPPAQEKLNYYASLGIECKVVKCKKTNVCDIVDDDETTPTEVNQIQGAAHLSPARENEIRTS